MKDTLVDSTTYYGLRNNSATQKTAIFRYKPVTQFIQQKYNPVLLLFAVEEH
jgi:hypothetical protein